MKRIFSPVAILLVLAVLFGMSASAAHVLDSPAEETAAYLSGSEDPAYAILSASLMGEVPQKEAVEQLKKQVSKSKGAYRGIEPLLLDILSLTAAGIDPRQVAGQNLIDLLCTFPSLKEESVPELAMTLFALTCGDFDPSEGLPGAWDKKSLTTALINAQQNDGSFGLTPKGPGSAGMTGLVLCALSGQSGQTTAFEQAQRYLSDNMPTQPLALSGSILGLTMQGASVTDASFVKDGTSPVDRLFLARNDDGGFSLVAGGESDALTSTVALAAMQAVRQGKSPFLFPKELTPYNTSLLASYGSFLLMTVGVIAIIYVMLLLTNYIGRRQRERQETQNSQNEEE